jgi:hypothetical protein
MLPEAAGDDATAAEAEIPVDMLGAAAVGVAAATLMALGTDAVVDVPKNSAAGVEGGGGVAGVVIGTRVVGLDGGVSIVFICIVGEVITVGVVAAGMVLS